METHFFVWSHQHMSNQDGQQRIQRSPTYIRQWRKKRGLTLEQVADRVGMTASALSYLERGLSAYNQENLELLSDALGTDPASLLMRNPEDEEAIWSLWEHASESERRQITDVVKALRRTG